MMKPATISVDVDDERPDEVRQECERTMRQSLEPDHPGRLDELLLTERERLPGTMRAE